MAFMGIQMRFKTGNRGHDFSEVKHCLCHSALHIEYYSEGESVFLKVVCFKLDWPSRDGYMKYIFDLKMMLILNMLYPKTHLTDHYHY